MLPEENKQIWQLLSDVLDYPNASLPESARKCAQMLEGFSLDTVRAMQSFVTFVRTQNIAQLEEVYTQTFEFNPATTLYIGYHVFGETPKRSRFMNRLKEAYLSQQFSIGGELPDHLCVLLRFLGTPADLEFMMPLIQDGILPALEKIENNISEKGNCYAEAVNSIRLFLKEAYGLKKVGDGHV